MTGSPTQIGRYTVARELGSGGMGEVYLAYSPAGSPVAVKVIRTDKLDPVTRARFEKEALIARTVIGTNRGSSVAGDGVCGRPNPAGLRG
jgi:serine/threonine protein kinase